MHGLQRTGGAYSERGARVIGPNANPRTHRLNPNVLTSLDTPKSLANFFEAGEKPDAVKLTVRSMSAMEMTMDHFRHVGQLRGFSVSPEGKVTSSTSVPSARWITWRGATPGSAVLPDAMLSGEGLDDMVFCTLNKISDERDVLSKMGAGWKVRLRVCCLR